VGSKVAGIADEAAGAVESRVAGAAESRAAGVAESKAASVAPAGPTQAESPGAAQSIQDRLDNDPDVIALQKRLDVAKTRPLTQATNDNPATKALETTKKAVIDAGKKELGKAKTEASSAFKKRLTESAGAESMGFCWGHTGYRLHQQNPEARWTFASRSYAVYGETLLHHLVQGV
jgi:hypothetical protein